MVIQWMGQVMLDNEHVYFTYVKVVNQIFVLNKNNCYINVKDWALNMLSKSL